MTITCAVTGISYQTRVMISSGNYVRSHGKTPRGRGLWALELAFAFADGGDEAQLVFAPTRSTLTDAVKWAKKVAKLTCESQLPRRVDSVDIFVMG